MIWLIAVPERRGKESTRRHTLGLRPPEALARDGSRCTPNPPIFQRDSWPSPHLPHPSQSRESPRPPVPLEHASRVRQFSDPPASHHRAAKVDHRDNGRVREKHPSVRSEGRRSLARSRKEDQSRALPHDTPHNRSRPKKIHKSDRILPSQHTRPKPGQDYPVTPWRFVKDALQFAPHCGDRLQANASIRRPALSLLPGIQLWPSA